MRTVRPALLLAAIALVASAPADARRFGGGRPVGMQRSVSTPHVAPEAPHSHLAPAATYSRAVGESRYSGGDLLGDVARASLRSRYLEDQNRREAEILERRRAERAARSGGGSPPGEAGPQPVAFQPPPDAAPPQPLNRAPRPADPRFTRLTGNPASSAPTCEFKPVMADRDYVVCGITPPSFQADLR
ncbi:MAG: hypothetical protein PHW25_14480 [Zoogloea sp.]|uniref:hypothetical protein n=1 Tax=Zoogloea sp. TaxID=49181 RepID=UPI00260BC56E|nr:hypothetical protein [Zoogloea sp.]MDD3328285.1 hypothetical protein [Zoogloea sp.]